MCFFQSVQYTLKEDFHHLSWLLKSLDFLLENSIDNQCILSGTIMSIKEKKTTKGSSFAIIKFSDLSKVYELLIFSELLDNNRKNLLVGRSFLITVIKDKENYENRFRRITVRKLVNIEDITKRDYNNVLIEMNSSKNLQKLYDVIKEKGNTKIKISIDEEEKNYLFETL